jgi:hypothetical protein
MYDHIKRDIALHIVLHNFCISIMIFEILHDNMQDS